LFTPASARTADVLREDRLSTWQVFIVIGALAGILLLSALTLPPPGRLRRVHLVYGLLVAALFGAAGWFANMDYRTERASRVADRLADGHYPPEARIHLALSFFEKNKDLYPDSYARMLEYVGSKGCILPEPGAVEKRVIECMRNQVETSIYFRGLLRSVAPPIPGEGAGH
jgi:hypothetical protein